MGDIDKIEGSCPDEILKAGLGPDIDAKLRKLRGHFEGFLCFGHTNRWRASPNVGRRQILIESTKHIFHFAPLARNGSDVSSWPVVHNLGRFICSNSCFVDQPANILSGLCRYKVLSDLLWAAFGVNRPSGDRTAPYWRHIMVIDVYAVMANGVWLYEPKRHALLPGVDEKDIKVSLDGNQLVISGEKKEESTKEEKDWHVEERSFGSFYRSMSLRMQDIASRATRLYASVDSGFIGQNVYLFCASEGLGTVFRGAVDYDKLSRAMQLGTDQFVTFAQTVGYLRS